MENNYNESYQTPWMEVIDLEDDIIQTSGGGGSELPPDYF